MRLAVIARRAKTDTIGIEYFVINVVEVSNDWTPEGGSWKPPDECFAVPTDEGDIGDIYDVENFEFLKQPSVGSTGVPQIISDRQFFQQLAVMGLITEAEALSAVKTGDIPATLMGLVSALPVEQQFAAEMLLSGAVSFVRSHPLTIAFGQAFGWTSEQLDGLWIEASKL